MPYTTDATAKFLRTLHKEIGGGRKRIGDFKKSRQTEGDSNRTKDKVQGAIKSLMNDTENINETTRELRIRLERLENM